jgi:autotransporter-associated beta strand protein
MLTIDGQIVQAAGLTMGLTADGTGVLVLDPLSPGNNNLYGGGTIVEAGTLQIEQDLALGNNETTVVDTGATLQLANGVDVIDQTLTLNGYGASGPNGPIGALDSAGSVTNIWGSAVITLPVILGSDTAIGAETGSTLKIYNIKDPTPPAVPASSLAKVGAGTVILPTANNYSGETYVNDGILNIQNNNALGVPTSNVQALTVTGNAGTGSQFQLTFNGFSTPAVGTYGALTVGSNSTPASALALLVQMALNALPSIQGASGTFNSTSGLGTTPLIINSNTSITGILSSGEEVTIVGTPADDGDYYAQPLNATQFALYTDPGLTMPYTGLGASAGGTWSATANPTSPGSVSVTYAPDGGAGTSGGVYTVTFNSVGQTAGTQPNITNDDVTQVAGGAFVSQTTLQDGSHGVVVNPTLAQNITVIPGDGGSFALTFNGSTSSSITLPDGNPEGLAADIQAVLNGVPNAGQTVAAPLASISGVGGSVTVTEVGSSDVYTVVFGGTLAQSTTALPLLSASISASGATAPTVTAAYADSAALQLEQSASNTSLSINKPLTIVGTGINGAGALENVANGASNPNNNSNTWTGVITLGGDPSIGADAGTTLTLPQAITEAVGSIASASNTAPVVITTTSTAGLTNGDQVTIENVQGNSAANGTFYVELLSPNSFELFQDAGLTTPVDGTAAGTDVASTGTWLGGFGLTTVGGGTIIETAVGGNSYSGTTNADGALLELDVTLGTAVPGPLVVGTGLGAVGADVVLLEQDYEIALSNLTINKDGVVETPLGSGGLLESVGNLTMTGGEFLMQDPNDSLTVVNNSVVTAQSDNAGHPAQITGGTLNISTTLGVPTVFDVSNNTPLVSPNLVITSQLNDFDNGLTMSGTGTLDLANNSTALTGPITIESGDLQVNGDVFDPNGTSSVTVDSGGTISSGSGPNAAVTGLITPVTTVTNSISGASDVAVGGPIEILTTSTAGLVNGDMVTVSGVLGDTAANGTWFVEVISSNSFELYQDYQLGVFSDPGVSSGIYTSGGSWALDSFIAPADGSLANANANAGTGYSLQSNVGTAEETWNSATTYSVALNDPTTSGFSSLLNVSGQGALVASGTITSITDDGLGDPYTVTTTDTTGLQTGDFVNISGTGPYDGTGDGQFDGTYQVSVDSLSGSISGASNTSPLTITTPIDATNGLFDGDQVTISGVGGNTAANGVFYVGNVTFDSFQLYQDAGLTIPVVGNGVYTSANGGGSWVDTAPVSGITTFTLNGTGDGYAGNNFSGTAAWTANASLNLNNANLNIAAATSVALMDASDSPNVIPIIEATTPGANIVGQFAQSSIIVGNGGTGQEFDVVYNYPGITYNGQAVSNVVLERTQEQADVNLTTYDLGSNVPTDTQQQQSKVVTLPYGEDQTITATVAPDNPNDAPIPVTDSVTFQITGIDNNGGVYLLGSVDVPLSLVGGVLEASTTLGDLTNGNAVAPTYLPGDILNTQPDNQSPNATPSYYTQYVINAYFNFSGSDPNYLPRTSAALDPTFTQDPSTLTATTSASPSSPTYGQQLAFTATVTPGTVVGTPLAGTAAPAGVVEFRLDNGASSPLYTQDSFAEGDSGIVTNGTASWTPTNTIAGNPGYANSTTLVPAGTHQLQVIYTTDGNYSVTNITNQQVHVLQDTVNVTLTEANGNYNANLGTPLTFQATVAPQAQGSTGVPTGSVFFYYTNASSNTLFLIGNSGQPLVSSGGEDVAQVTISNLPAGVHEIYAEYGGDGNYLSNVVSNTVENEVPLEETVGQGTTVTTVTLPAGFGTSPNYTEYFGQVASITATIVGSGAFGVPAGTVQFEIEYPSNPTNPVAVGTVPVFTSGGNGEAIFSTASLPAPLNADANPAADIYTILASYQASATGNYASSLSSGVNLTVTPAVTTTTLQSFGSSLQYGQAATLSATVVVAHNEGVGTPDGSVTFILEGPGGGVLGTSQLNGSGVATLALSSLTTPLELGTNDIYAQYNADAGDYNFTQSASPVAPPSAPNEGVVQVVQANTHVVLSGVGTAVAGQLLTFTAVVSAPSSTQTPVGTVNFYNNSITSPALVGTTAYQQVGSTLEALFTPATSLSVGTHTILAQFVGTAEPNPPDPQNNIDFAGSTASSTETVNKASTQTVIEATGPIDTSYGVPLSLLSVAVAVVPTVGAGVPTGTVVFFANPGNITLGSGTLTTGLTTLSSTSPLGVGTYTVTAQYQDDSNFLTSPVSNSLVIVVGAAATTTTLPSGPVVAGQGSTLTFTATVTTASGTTPTGTVDFYKGTPGPSTLLGSGTVNGSGHATFATSTLTTGVYSINASYLVSTDFSASTTYLMSGPETVTIEGASSTTIAGSPSPSTYGQSVTLTASVTGAGAGSPAGTVNFYDTLLSNTIPLNPTPISLTTNPGNTETATLVLSTQENLYLSQLDPNLAEGAHDLIATYTGSNYAPSTSTALVQVVFADGTSTTIAVTPTSPENYGTTLSFTATVTNTAVVASVPVGTLTFYDGSTSLGVGTATTTTANTQVYTLSDSLLNAGIHTLTAAFATATSGVHANDYGPSTSSGATVGYTINKVNTSTTVSVSSTSTVYGEAETLTATVAASPSGAVPVGTVTFRDGSTTGPVLGTAQSTVSNGGVATLPYNTLSVSGSPHTIVASFVANAFPVQDFNSSSGSSSPTTVTATKDTTTVTVGVPGVSQTYGSTVTLSATIVSFYGATPTGTVTFHDGSTTGPVLGTAGVTLNGSGVATTTTTTIDVQHSPHTIFAVYSNTDGNFLGSSNDALYSATAANTSVSVSASANPTGQSQLTTFTATVTSPGATVNEGSVTFEVSSGPDAGFANTAKSVNASGQATFATSALDLQGTYYIEAVYSDTATNFNGSNNLSNLFAEVVATQTTATSAVTISPTATPVWGQPVTLTAVVTNATLTPTGTLTFNDGIGPVTATAGASTSTSQTYTAVVSSLTTTGLNNLTVHPLYASFSGTGQFGSSSSLTTTNLQYSKANTATSVTANGLTAASSTTGSTVTFTATVAASGLGEGTPVGTMTFTDTTGSPVVLKSGATISVVGGQDIATFSTAGLATGLHTIQATFTDTDGDYNNSTTNTAMTLNVAPVAASIAPVTSPTSSTLLPEGTDIQGKPAFMKTVTHGQSFNLYLAAFGTNPASGPIATGYTGVATILLTSESVNGDTLSSNSFSVNMTNGVGTSAALTCVKAGVYLVKVYVPITGAGAISGSGSAFTLQITAL